MTNWQKSDTFGEAVPFEQDYLTIPVNTKHVSDGHHTFGELYHYRMLYNAAFFNLLAEVYPEGIDGTFKVMKSRKHHNGHYPFDSSDWFIVVWDSPYGQISNHYKMEYWNIFSIPEVDLPPIYDGHNSVDASDRLMKWLRNDQV